MKEFKRIIAFVLTIVLLMGTFAFADTPKTTKAVIKEPTATIVSPTNNSIVSSDTFLVSVKLNKAATVKISVYEQKEVVKKVVTEKISGSAVTKEAISYVSFDTSKFQEKDFTSNAALNNSQGFIYSTPASYTSKDNIGFYTSKVENVKPGIYKVVVETVEQITIKDEKTGKETKVDRVVETVSSLIAVKEKVEAAPAVFEQKKEKNSVLTVVSNFLKTIFK